MSRPLGTMPRSDCNRALVAAGLPLEPPATGVRYSHKELLAIRETPGGMRYDDWRERRARSTQAVAARREQAAAE